MARHKNSPTPAAEDPTDMESVKASSRAASELVLVEEQAAARALELATRLGYEGSLAPDVLEQGIRSEQRRAVHACLNLGSMLLLLKEQCPHGEFMARLASMGWDRTVATRLMQAALKFSNSATSHHLIEAVGSQSKLFELLVLDDQEITELCETGAVHGITVDDIDSLGVRELRARLRQAERDKAAKDRVIKKKSEANDKLIEAEEARREAPLPEQEARQLDELRDATLAAQQALSYLLKVVDEVTADPASDAAGLAARQTLDYVAQRMAEAAEQRGLALNLDGDLLPTSMKQIRDAIESSSQAAKGRARK